MEQTNERLVDRLRPYPNLHDVLGSRWVDEQDQIDPAFSPFALARWLRIQEFTSDFAMLNAVIARLAHLPNFREHRLRLRNDSAGLIETLTELYFGAWLLERGYRFEFTTVGADLVIDLGDGSHLLAEVTTPRRAVWSQDLFERLDILTERFGYSVRLELRRETLPDPSATEAVVTQIVARSIALLSAQVARLGDERDPLIIQEHSEVDLSMEWTLNRDNPRVTLFDSPESSSEWQGFKYVADAARTKSRQLPNTQAGLLVVGTRQMPELAWLNFMEALRVYPEQDTPFDWSRLPGNVKHVLLYSFVLRQVEPWQAIMISNENNSLPDPPGFAEFSRSLCPAPYRAE